MRTISINPNFFGKYNTQKELFKKVLDFVKNDLVGQKNNNKPKRQTNGS